MSKGKPRLPRQSWSRSPVTRVKVSKKVYKREKKIEWENENAKSRGFSFCPWCGSKLTEKEIDHRVRLQCAACGYINYNNPLPACAVILEMEDKLLLCQRKYPPQPDGWTLPSGFMESDETPQECARREAKEETNLETEIGEVFGVYAAGDDPRAKVVLVVFLGKIIGGELQAGDDAKRVKYFAPQELPENIAFRAHRKALREYYARKNIPVSI
jgi:ADP-ribose pyrophosphatase YjhB (NUDIX family)